LPIQASTSWSRFVAGTTCSTNPHASASLAEKVSPSSKISRARPQPVSNGNSAASITEGMPILTSGMPNEAVSEAKRTSQAAAISSPAPKQKA
jgi:hypothetical protein